MRGLNTLAASALQPRNLFYVALLGASLWAAAGGLMPNGPKVTEAVEARPVAELTGPGPQDRTVTQIVTSLMRREHLSKHPLDDEISRRGLELFVKSLDGMKLYFYQSDIDEFSQKKNELDDMLLAKDVSYAYTIFNRLLKRVDERVALVDELLKKDFDFTVDEVLVTDPDKLSYPKTPAEAEDRWRKRLKYDILLLKSEKNAEKKEGEAPTSTEDPRERLKRRYHSFAKRMHQTDSNELLEMYLSAMTNGFDPHSTYMAPASSENFNIIMALQLEGIGAQLKMDDGYTVIDKLITGGAAEKAGELKVGDRVVSVGQGVEGEMVDVAEMKLNDVVQLIRGRAGSVVRLGLIAATGPELRIIKITRAKVELKDSEASAEIIEEGKKGDGTPFKIGVIDLPSFYMDMSGAREGSSDFKSCSRDVRRILEDFNKKGVDVVMLDLRRNGGGSLTEAISLTGFFIEAGPVLQVKDPDGQIHPHDDNDRGILWKGPLVVMTSKFSASASEILAGAIQDYKRGLVIGDSATHGKGTVQTMVDLGPQMFRVANPPDLGALKLTVQQFYRPSGDSTQQRGVLADITLPSITDHMDIAESDLDYPVAFDKVPAAAFTRFDSVNPNIVGTLKEKATQRMEESKDFQELRKDIERYTEQKAKKQVPLNEEKFLARRAELDSDKEEEKTFEHQANGNDSGVVKRDYYFNEVLNITLDYLRLLGKDKVAQN
ncbi:MAG: carboxy terminal-processing peptidase [Pirellulaceae bacterium]